MREINRSLTAKHLGNRLILDGRPFVGGICLHDTAGSGTHNDTKYLSNPGDGRPVSVDFTVERDGSIWQLNPDLVRRCTNHAGRATQWKAAGRVFRNRAVTQVLIGIEIVHNADPSKQMPIWPAEQIQSVAELCVYLCDDFALTKEQITTHAKIITDGSRTDPRNFPFDNFWFYFNAAASDPAENDTPALTEPVIYTVVPGDSLWSISKRFAVSIEDIKQLNQLSDPSNIIRPGQKLILKK